MANYMYIGQYRVYTWEAVMLSTAGCLSSATLLSLIVVYLAGGANYLRRHPGPLLLRKCCCELVFSVMCIFMPFLTQHQLYDWGDRDVIPLHATSTTQVLASLTEWSFLATEMWFLAMSMDLLSTVSNPFHSYHAHRRFYRRLCFGVPFCAALVVMSLEKTNIGITRFYAAWVVRKCTYAEHENKDKDACDHKWASALAWLLFYSWILLIYSYSLFAWVYARRRLAAGMASTLSARESTIKRSGINLLAWYFYWVVPFCLLVVSAYTSDLGEVDNVHSASHWIGFSLCLVLSLRGTYTCLAILTIDRKDIFRSKTEMEASVRMEDESFSPHLNSALRSEILHYATLCIRNAVLRESHVFEDESDPEAVPSPLQEQGSIQMTSTSTNESAGGRESMFSRQHNPRSHMFPVVHMLMNHLDPPPSEDCCVYEISRDEANGLAEDPLRARLQEQQERETRISREQSLRFQQDQLARERLGHELLRESFGEAAARPSLTAAGPSVLASDSGARVLGADRADFSLPPAPPSERVTEESDKRFADSVHTVSGVFNGSGTLTAKLRHFLGLGGEVLKFVDYKPEVFQQLRRLQNLDKHEFARSWAGTSRASFSEGASGAFVFFSKDEKYIVKTTTKCEMRQLEALAEDYLQHLTDNPDSFLLRIYGAHSMEIYGQKLYFLVMNNIFPPEAPPQERYDLKGSWVNRQSGGKPGDKKVLKDMDLNYGFKTSGAVGLEVAQQLDRDSDFLASKNLMDYSLLVGVVHKHFKVDNIDLDPEDPFERNQHGALTADIVTGPGDFYIGIIDILQEWNLQKKFEHWFKVLFRCADGPGLSAVPAAYYKRRFMQNAVYSLFAGALGEQETPDSFRGSLESQEYAFSRATVHETASSASGSARQHPSFRVPASSSRDSQQSRGDSMWSPLFGSSPGANSESLPPGGGGGGSHRTSASMPMPRSAP